MARLTDADEFVRNFSTWMNRQDEEHGDSNFVLGIKLMLEELQNAPTVDAEPVKHGHWEDCSNGWMCSVCFRDVSKDYEYCPNCGAKMDGERKEDEQE